MISIDTKFTTIPIVAPVLFCLILKYISSRTDIKYVIAKAALFCHAQIFSSGNVSVKSGIRLMAVPLRYPMGRKR
jgi:hypothetical protein